MKLQLIVSILIHSFRKNPEHVAIINNTTFMGVDYHGYENYYNSTCMNKQLINIHGKTFYLFY